MLDSINPQGAAKGGHVFAARGHEPATGAWRRIVRENMAPRRVGSVGRERANASQV